jgi:hypothetical protein
VSDRTDDIRNALAAILGLVPRDTFDALVSSVEAARIAAEIEIERRQYAALTALLSEADSRLTLPMVKAVVWSLAMSEDAEAATLRLVRSLRAEHDAEMEALNGA